MAFIFLINSFDGAGDNDLPISIFAYSRKANTVNELISENNQDQTKINVNYNKADITIDPKSNEWGGQMYIYILKD